MAACCRHARSRSVTPLVSVWIPSYNHAPYLGAAIESVLGQTVQDVELVVVDDGSSDASLEVAERYAASHTGRMTVLTHPGHVNLGVAATGTLAKSHARGRFLLGLASDDMLYPDAIECQVDFLERNPGVGFVYGYAHVVDESGHKLPGVRAFGVDLTKQGRTVERLVQGNQIPAMTAMVRRECSEQVGGEDGTLFYSDWELWVRAAAHWDVGFIPRPLAKYRVHGANTGFNVDRHSNVERSLEVTCALRERAQRIGGRLAEPRVLATLELQLGFLRYAAGDRAAGSDALAAAFDRDPSLANDGRWLSDWLRARILDPLLPDGAEFGRWLVPNLSPFVTTRAGRALWREAGAADREAKAARLARANKPAEARRAALGAIVRRPRRVRDRRLITLLLDSIAGGGPADGLRWLKRRLFGYR